MNLNPYLTFDGRCEEAFRYYRRVLGGEIEYLLTFGDAPSCGDVPFEWYDCVMHACLVFGDRMLMGSDAPPGQFERAAGFSVTLAFDEPGEAERVFREFSKGGVVRMPMEETFWARRFGMVTDRFGIPWNINGGLVDVVQTRKGEIARCVS